MIIPFDIVNHINIFFDDCLDTIKISYLSSSIFQNRKKLKLQNIGKLDSLLFHHIHENYDIEYLNLEEYHKLFEYHIKYEKFDFFEEIQIKYPQFKFFLCTEENKKNIPENVTHLYVQDDVILETNFHLPKNLIYLHYLRPNIQNLNLPKSIIHLSITNCDPQILIQLPKLKYVDFKTLKKVSEALISYPYSQLPDNLISLSLFKNCGNLYYEFPENLKILKMNCKYTMANEIYLPNNLEVICIDIYNLKKISNIPISLKKVIICAKCKYYQKYTFPVLGVNPDKMFGLYHEFPKVKFNHNSKIKILSKNHHYFYKIYNNNDKYYMYQDKI